MVRGSGVRGCWSVKQGRRRAAKRTGSGESLSKPGRMSASRGGRVERGQPCAGMGCADTAWAPLITV